MYYNRLAGYLRNSFSEPFERTDASHGRRQVGINANWARPRLGRRPPLTEEDLRIHAWLNERLAALHRERRGLWPRVKRLFRAIVRSMSWPFVPKERFNTD
jgi:hypothetical protein